MGLSESERELLIQAPHQWALLGPAARFIDSVQILRDKGLVKTRMVPLLSKPGHAQMEWQITRKGSRVIAALSD